MSRQSIESIAEQRSLTAQSVFEGANFQYQVADADGWSTHGDDVCRGAALCTWKMPRVAPACVALWRSHLSPNSGLARKLHSLDHKGNLLFDYDVSQGSLEDFLDRQAETSELPNPQG